MVFRSLNVALLTKYGEMPATDPSRKCRFRRSLPHLGTPCNLRFQHTFQGSLGAYAVLIWEMSATDPSRKWSFRRSLPQLGTACNLRFFACIHTSAFIKETLRKLDWIRSQLYEQLRRRPRHRFSQNHTLHTMHTQNHARTAQKTIFSPARKSRPRA